MSALQYAFVFLLAAVVAVPIAKRLNLGSVLGYLIAGIVIGPALGLIGSETEAIKHFAEFGVVMMLFLVGLELQPALLWRMRGRLFGLGGLQVLITSLLLAGIGMIFDLSWQVCLASGMILALSSTAIVLQTLSEKGWIKSVAGQSAFSVLLFQDIAVIPMIALLPLLATSKPAAASGAHHAGGIAHLPGWAQAVVILGVIAAIIVIGRFLIRPIFRFIAGARLREIFTAAALLLVIAISLAMQQVGLSPALGTFLAGVVLSDSEYRHELESDIEPFKGLLLGLFFISVGAGIDFKLLFSQPGLIAGLAGVIIITKLAVLQALARLFRLARGQGWLFSLGLAQAGEFAFVLFGVARGGHVLPAHVTELMTLVVAITMLLTPLLFIIYEKIIAARLVTKAEREADVIEERGTVVVAGVGRFGQVVSRFLISCGYKVIVLDHDPALIDLVAKFGSKTYYGDATRPDLLHAAGLQEAQLLVTALDDRESQNLIVSHVAKTYPQCRIVARAFDRHHLYELECAGAHVVERETFEAALSAGRASLIALGVHPFRAEQKSRIFRRHDLETLETLRQTFHDEGMDKTYIGASRQRRQELFDVMQADRADRHDSSERGWTPPPKEDAQG